MSIPRRPIGTTGVELSRLGFGCMRLPVRMEGDAEVVDREEAVRIIRLGIELGINYLDTAWIYHHGESEEVVGQAVQGPWRERVQVSTKMPLWLINGPDDFEVFLEKQLERLGTTIDFYHLHAINRTWLHDRVVGWKLMERMERARSDGRIRHFSFSFHDKPEVLREVLETGLFASMLVQYNLIDPGLAEMIDLAAERGVGVMVMGPIGGGRLAQSLPGVEALLPPGMELTELAMRYVLANPAVDTVLSGMGSEAMVRANCALAGLATPLDAEGTRAAEAVTRHLAEIRQIPCTECGYCSPCPEQVNIPAILKILGDQLLYGEKSGAAFRYGLIGDLPTLTGKDGGACTACGVCLDKCPQGLVIPELIARAHRAFRPEG